MSEYIDEEGDTQVIPQAAIPFDLTEFLDVKLAEDQI